MKPGDKVIFIGNKEQFKVAFQPKLKRVGTILPPYHGDVWNENRIRVRLDPKTKKGYPEFVNFKSTELEVIEDALKEEGV